MQIFSLEIPPGLMAFLVKFSGLDDFAIRSALGISPQVIREMREGRGSLSPFKSDQVAAMCGLSCGALKNFVERANHACGRNDFKVGQKVEHPFRGVAQIVEIRHDLCDIQLTASERMMHNVPLIVFRKKELGEIMQDIIENGPLHDLMVEEETDLVIAAEEPADENVKPRVGSALAELLAKPVSQADSSEKNDIAAKESRGADAFLAASRPQKTAPSHDTAEKDRPIDKERKPVMKTEPAQNDVARLIARGVSCGLGHKEMAFAIGVSRSMIGSYNSGRNRMSRERFDLLKTHIDMLSSGKKGAPPPDPQKPAVKPGIDQVKKASASPDDTVAVSKDPVAADPSRDALLAEIQRMGQDMKTMMTTLEARLDTHEKAIDALAQTGNQPGQACGIQRLLNLLEAGLKAEARASR